MLEMLRRPHDPSGNDRGEANFITQGKTDHNSTSGIIFHLKFYSFNNKFKDNRYNIYLMLSIPFICDQENIKIPILIRDLL